MPFNSVTACVVSSMIIIAVAIAFLETQITIAQIKARTKQMIPAPWYPFFWSAVIPSPFANEKKKTPEIVKNVNIPLILDAGDLRLIIQEPFVQMKLHKKTIL